MTTIRPPVPPRIIPPSRGNDVGAGPSESGNDASLHGCSSPSPMSQTADKPSIAPPKRPTVTAKRESIDAKSGGTELEDPAYEAHTIFKESTNGQLKKGAAKKKKANRACAACQRAHLTCDDGKFNRHRTLDSRLTYITSLLQHCFHWLARPCSRCVKKGIEDQCTDGKRKRAKYLLDEDELEAIKAKERAEKDKERASTVATSKSPTAGALQLVGISPPQQVSGKAPIIPSLSAAPPFFAGLTVSEGQSPHNDPVFAVPELPSVAAASIQDTATGLSETSTFNGGQKPSQATTGTTSPCTFGSEATSLEYSILSSMLNGIDPNLLSGSPEHGVLDGSLGVRPAVDPTNTSMTSAAGLSGGEDVFPSGRSLDGAGLDLATFFCNASTGQILASVSMATDTSSYCLSNASAALAPLQATPSWPNATCGSHANKPVGQLHAIGGQDQNGNEGEVGSEGFKALEVPSPSLSLVSSRPDGTSSADSFSPQNLATQGDQFPALQTQPSSSATANGRSLSSFEAQWRERVNHIYGDLTKPFPYTEGYHFLLKFVTDKFEKAEVLRIVRALGLFRPSLIALQMPLTEEDEVFVERSIQRTILEFEKLVSCACFCFSEGAQSTDI